MKFYMLIVLLLASVQGIAQTNPIPSGIEATENVRELGTLSGTGIVKTFDNRYEGTRGTPYVFEQWLPGEVILNSNKRIIIEEMNYNCFDNEISYLEPSSKAVMMLNMHLVDYFYFITQGDTLLFGPIQPDEDEEPVYAQILYEGKYALYKLYSKEFVRADYEGAYSADRKYDEFADKSSLYLMNQKEKELIRFRNSKKQLVSAFPDAEDQISAYIKAEKLKLKDEEDLVRLLEYYDSL